MATIMVVDDYPVTQRILSFQLNKEGHQVVTASNGREALESLTELTVDLVVLDLVMPEMDGVTMLHYLRSDHRFKGVPVIMLTGSAEQQDRQAALSAGADAFLTKPTASWELTDMVGDLLHEKLIVPV